MQAGHQRPCAASPQTGPKQEERRRWPGECRVERWLETSKGLRGENQSRRNRVCCWAGWGWPPAITEDKENKYLLGLATKRMIYQKRVTGFPGKRSSFPRRRVGTDAPPGFWGVCGRRGRGGQQAVWLCKGGGR